MAVPSLLERAVDGTIVALRFSEALSTTLPSINRFAVLVNGSRVYAVGAAGLYADGTISASPSPTLLPLVSPSPSPTPV